MISIDSDVSVLPSNWPCREDSAIVLLEGAPTYSTSTVWFQWLKNSSFQINNKEFQALLTKKKTSVINGFSDMNKGRLLLQLHQDISTIWTVDWSKTEDGNQVTIGTNAVPRLSPVSWQPVRTAAASWRIFDDVHQFSETTRIARVPPVVLPSERTNERPRQVYVEANVRFEIMLTQTPKKMATATIPPPAKREAASTANVLMCKQWWKVCWMYGDQEKYYRQLYGRQKNSDAQKSVYPRSNDDKLEQKSAPHVSNSPYNSKTTDWAVQFYQSSRLFDDTPPPQGPGSIGTNPMNTRTNKQSRETGLNRSFSFEEVRVPSSLDLDVTDE
ncbi:hypothetical protein GWI33_003314 [Rhynchophorus ferrugineus]|uniref:Uncharacterized protein n=1 Tax=Rhynchophorus ferrugineus TaxID=354439 RepID=A0A834MFV5_RHYFE|nr:hypothetical protein GWI33_003314 [Rhynchophorus ferrugineus]